MMKDIVKQMHYFIKNENEFKVANPTNENENFAEKWNDDVIYAKTFALWQQVVYNELEELQKQSGIDTLGAVIKKSYGKDSVKNVLESLTKEVNNSRKLGLIATGIITATESTATIKDNKFFGAH